VFSLAAPPSRAQNHPRDALLPTRLRPGATCEELSGGRRELGKATVEGEPTSLFGQRPLIRVGAWPEKEGELDPLARTVRRPVRRFDWIEELLAPITVTA
jgi:hypothetical protein